MKISLESSEQLIKSAGFILCNSTKITTDDANEFLIAQGFKAISEKDYYKSRKNKFLNKEGKYIKNGFDAKTLNQIFVNFQKTLYA